jgi:NitT/TauT family transport system substrate-binding protein
VKRKDTRQELKRAHAGLWLLLLLTLVGTLVFAGCGGGDEEGAEQGPPITGQTGESGEPTKVTLRLDWVAQGYQAPFYAALGLGYYEDEGLDVKILDGRGTSTTIKLVANGSNTFGFGQLSEMAFAVANHDVPLKAIAGVYQQMPDAVFIRAGSGISSLPDLEGKEVISSAGDSTRTFFPALAEANGFDASKVTFLNVSGESKTTTFIAGRGDAMLNFATDEFLVEDAGVEAEVLMYADHGVNVISQGLFTSVDYLDENPGAVAGFVRASMKGLEYARDNPEEAAKWVLHYRPGAEKEEQALFELNAALPLSETENTKGHSTGYMAAEDWEQSISLMQQYQDMKEVPPDEIYTNEFVGE